MMSEKVFMGVGTITGARTIGSDHLPVTQTIPVSQEYVEVVIKRLVNDLYTDTCFDILHLGPISGRYREYERLAAALNGLANSNARVIERSSEVQTYFKLQNSFEEQLATLSKKQRDEIKRKYVNPIKKGVRIYSKKVGHDDFEKEFLNFMSVHQAHWKEQGKAGHFGSWPGSGSFHREFSASQIQNDRLRLYKIYYEDICIGYNYSFIFGDTYYRYLYARTSDSKTKKIDFSKIDYAEMLKRAFQENVIWFDSMRSKYDHKMLLGGELYPIRNVYILKGRKYRILITRLLMIYLRIYNLIYIKIYRMRLAKRLHTKNGPFNRFWLRWNLFGG